MEFKIKYYKDSSGKSPIEEFLLELKRSNNPLAEQALKGLEKLRNRNYHKEPLSKYLESGLWELRIRAGTNILRIVYSFNKDKLLFFCIFLLKNNKRHQQENLRLQEKGLKK